MSTAQSRYAEYLTSDYWKAVSEAVRAKAGYRCQICNSPHDLQAHHRSYAHRGRELDHLDDLTCLCRRCHEIFHGKRAAPIQQPVAQQPKPAPAAPVPSKPVMVLITEANHRRLQCHKEPWHWMKDHGIDPQRSGWSKRAIGYEVPAKWVRGR
jgi:hypothetical protein